MRRLKSKSRPERNNPMLPLKLLVRRKQRNLLNRKSDGESSKTRDSPLLPPLKLKLRLLTKLNSNNRNKTEPRADSGMMSSGLLTCQTNTLRATLDSMRTLTARMMTKTLTTKLIKMRMGSKMKLKRILTVMKMTQVTLMERLLHQLNQLHQLLHRRSLTVRSSMVTCTRPK